MARKYSITKADLEFMAKDIGPQLLPFLSPEERLRGLSSEDLLEHVSFHDLLRHISTEAQQRQLNTEEREMLRQLLD